MKGNGTLRRDSLSRLCSACGHGRDSFLVLRDEWDIVCTFVAIAVGVWTVRVTGPEAVGCSKTLMSHSACLHGSLSCFSHTQALSRLRF